MATAEGQDWVIHTSLRRRWHDGTEFTIRAAGDDEHRILSATNGYQLTITSPAGLKAHSHHVDVQSAKAHADALITSLTSPNLDDYRVDEPATEQLELA